jgi:hypothetical protein
MNTDPDRVERPWRRFPQPASPSQVTFTDAFDREWQTIDRTFYPTDAQIRAAPDFIIERYRRAANETQALFPHDYPSLLCLWERMFWFLRHYFEQTLSLDPTGEAPMDLINGVICSYNATDEEIEIEVLETGDEDWNAEPDNPFIVVIRRDARLHLDRTSPYFFDYWIDDERYEEPPMTNAVYDVWCCMRLAMARTIWRKEHTDGGADRSFVKWDLPSSTWIISHSDWIHAILGVYEGVDTSEAMSWLVKKAQLDEDAAADRHEGEMGSTDGTEFVWEEAMSA